MSPTSERPKLSPSHSDLECPEASPSAPQRLRAFQSDPEPPKTSSSTPEGPTVLQCPKVPLSAPECPKRSRRP